MHRQGETDTKKNENDLQEEKRPRCHAELSPPVLVDVVIICTIAFSTGSVQIDQAHGALGS